MRRSLTAAGCLILLFFLCLCTASVYGDVTPEQIESLTKKLERWEAEEAWTEVQEYLSSDPGARDLFELASHIAFYRGDYREALRFSKAAMEVWVRLGPITARTFLSWASLVAWRRALVTSPSSS